MPTYNSLEEAIAYAKKSAIQSLKSEVAQIIKEVEVEKIKSEVLDIYTPTMYSRREQGGIDDISNIKASTIINGDSVVLNVENKTKPNSAYGNNKVDSLAGLIEYGDNGGYGSYKYTRNKGGQSYGDVDAIDYLKPRPFEEVTVNHLKTSRIHIQILKSGLLKRKILID